jgi:hypothetical protein
MVMGTGVPVVPPVMLVLDPTVLVVDDSVYVSEPQKTTVAFCVVVVGSSMEVVPLQTLLLLRCQPPENHNRESRRQIWATYGVTVMVMSGGCTELVKAMTLSLVSVGRTTFQTGISVVVTDSSMSAYQDRRTGRRGRHTSRDTNDCGDGQDLVCIPVDVVELSVSVTVYVMKLENERTVVHRSKLIVVVLPSWRAGQTRVWPGKPVTTGVLSL